MYPFFLSISLTRIRKEENKCFAHESAVSLIFSFRVFLLRSSLTCAEAAKPLDTQKLPLTVDLSNKERHTKRTFTTSLLISFRAVSLSFQPFTKQAHTALLEPSTQHAYICTYKIFTYYSQGLLCKKVERIILSECTVW